ncbi:hypothetical protein L2E82_31432 [Cichorium intybus]|uniref:Uncharacterized protein n=1 Tax=Cichorium intybus TaxID=13427 RepID=A0ACB9D309_CICIN|nr:hypothetical protein L2E82_31432 [Cichorium intybus]
MEEDGLMIDEEQCIKEEEIDAEQIGCKKSIPTSKMVTGVWILHESIQCLAYGALIFTVVLVPCPLRCQLHDIIFSP